MAWNTNLRWRLPVICLLLQVALVVLFGVFVRYDLDADAHWIEERMSRNISSDLDNEFYYRYPSKSHHLAGPAAAYPSCPHRAEGPTGLRAPPGLTSAACCSGTWGRQAGAEEEMLPTGPLARSS